MKCLWILTGCPFTQTQQNLHLSHLKVSRCSLPCLRPESKFPFAPERKYTPCDASKDQLFKLRNFLGFERNVIVQASCHGTNNDALEDALLSSNNLARGVAVVSPDINQGDLKRLDAAGVRAVRFNFLKRLVDNAPKDTFQNIAKKIADLGWHVVVYVEAQDLEDLATFLKSLPTDIIFDHMARPDVNEGLNSKNFVLFQKLMENEKFWCKTSCPERLSQEGPEKNYSDILPFGVCSLKIILSAFMGYRLASSKYEISYAR